MAYPYLPDVAGILGEPLEHVFTLTAQPPYGDPVELEVIGDSLQIEYAEDWSPHIRLSATCVVPAAADLDRMDPRTRTRLTLSAGYVLPDGSRRVSSMADLALQSRDVSRPDSVMKITALSDEIRAQDRRTVSTVTPPFSGLNELVRWAAAQAMYPEEPVIETVYTETTGSAMVKDLEIPVGGDLWAPMADVAARVGAWLHVTEDRVWTLRKRAAVSGSPDVHLTVGQSGTILSSDAGLSREDWANYVLLEYRFKDASGARTVYGRAKVVGGRFRPSAAGYRMYTESRDLRATAAQADAAAASVLDNLVTRGRTLTVRAIAAYWLRPGETVLVTLPTGDTEAHLVRSVSFRPAAGTMTVVTRQPNDSTIETGE